MLYDIRLRITYNFAAPTGGGRHHLRLLPAALPGEQRLIAAELGVTPPATERAEFRDFFGNQVIEVVLPPGLAALTFTTATRLDRTPPPLRADLSPPLVALPADLWALRTLGPDAPHHFLGTSPRIRAEPAITAYARKATAKARTTAEAVIALGQALHQDMTFDASSTTVDTPPVEAFAAMSGVCQDFAQVMIAGLRGLGVPAAYVSGFLRTVPPPGKARLEGADAMHAWVRVWCGAAAGWMDYDPTNAMPAAGDHIVVARGRDYGDVAPVTGILRLAGGQTSRQAVDVIALPD